MNAPISGHQIDTMQLSQSTWMFTRNVLSRGLLAGSLLLLVTTAAIAQSSLLDSLPTDTQEAIGRVCLPVQYREGAGAYRNCIQAELDLYRNGSTTELGKLSFDDKYAVQQACAKAGSRSSGEYKSCVSQQIADLNKIVEPALNQLSEDEAYVVQQSCFSAQSKEGAAPYRNCLNNEIASLQSIPAADTSKLGMLKKNALQLRCSSNSSSAVQYRRCVANEYESIAGSEPSFLPVSTAASIARPVNTVTTNTPVAETVAAVNTASDSTTRSSSQSENEQTLTEASVIESGQTSSPTRALPRNITPPSRDAVVAEVTANTEVIATNAKSDETVVAADQNEAQETLTAQNDQPQPNTLRDATGDSINPAQTDSAPADLAEANLAGTELAQADVTDQPTNESATNDARVISRPNLVETLELQERAAAQGIELDGEPEANTNPASSATGSAQASELIGKFSAFGQSLLDKLAALDRIGWLIVAGVLALPAILLGLFSLSRRTGNSRPAEPNPSPLSERVEPGLQTRRLRHEREAAELFDDEVAKASAVSDEIDTSPLPMSGHAMSFEDSLDDTPEHDAVTRLAAKPLSSDGRALPEQKKTPLQQPANDEIAAPRQSSENPVWQSAFGSWLMHQPEQDRMGFCIEFLIYWVAYSDDRYQPDLRKRLFTATDLSPHDQIKRWVLKQDVFAFSDVVNWLRRNGSPQQLDQCVALIMALLVTENNITPVQNTLIRFFADAFNIGIDRVERRFENAFGHALPPIPRPDKALWWDKQQESSLTAWDARAMANNSEHEQLLARLGLQANYEDAQIIQAFRRAARRCHPDRFTELGDRERSMAEQQFIKFEQARDKLLGVSV